MADKIERLATAMLALDDEAFRDVIDDDLRKRGEDRSDWETGLVLRHPLVVERFYMELLRLGKSIEGQLSTLEADYQARRARLEAKLSIAQSQVATGRANGETQGKIVNMTADLKTQRSEFMSDRAKKLRFKTGLDMHTIEVRYIVDSLRPSFESLVAEERNHYSARCRQLENAIRDHQTAVLDDTSIEPSRADEELWSVLAREAMA